MPTVLQLEPTPEGAFECLPLDLMYQIFSLLDGVSLAKLSQTSGKIREVVMEDLIWQEVVHNTWKNLVPDMIREKEEFDLTWKDCYVNQHLMDQNWLEGRCTTGSLLLRGGGVSAVQFQHNLIVCGSSDACVRVMDFSGNFIHEMPGHNATISGIRIHHPTAATTATATAAAPGTISGDNGSGTDEDDLGSDGFRFVSSSRDGCIRIWDTSGCCLRTMEGHTEPIIALECVGDWIITASEDHTITVRDFNTGELLKTLAGHAKAVKAVIGSQEENCIISGSADTTIAIWDVESERKLYSLTGHHDDVCCLAMNSDFIASGSWDGTLIVWSRQEFTATHILKGHSRGISCIQMDHTKIITGSVDTSIRIWDIQTGTCNVNLVGHADTVNALQFDRKKIVSGSEDGSIRVWEFF
eukprot:GFYU01020811.1.p1 GENE.GFYU01020811.1~~GFYU01020811.1.p1  ORF type:complete len:412 (-),score=74.12 GFYU01020811.1:109-1344(-)